MTRIARWLATITVLLALGIALATPASAETAADDSSASGFIGIFWIALAIFVVAIVIASILSWRDRRRRELQRQRQALRSRHYIQPTSRDDISRMDSTYEYGRPRPRTTGLRKPSSDTPSVFFGDLGWDTSNHGPSKSDHGGSWGDTHGHGPVTYSDPGGGGDSSSSPSSGGDGGGGGGGGE